MKAALSPYGFLFQRVRSSVLVIHLEAECRPISKACSSVSWLTAALVGDVAYIGFDSTAHSLLRFWAIAVYSLNSGNLRDQGNKFQLHSTPMLTSTRFKVLLLNV